MTKAKATTEWKTMWIGAATTVFGALAGLTVWAGLARLLTLGAALLLVAAVFLVSPAIVDHAEMFRRTSARQRRRIVLGVSAATAAYAGWTVTAVFLPRTPLVLIGVFGGLGLLGVAVYALARALEWQLTHVPPAPPKAVTEGPSEPADKLMQHALRRAGFGALTVLGHTKSGQGDRLMYRFKIRVRSQAATAALAEQKGKDKAKTTAGLSRDAALNPSMTEPVAIALGEILQRDIESDWVRLRKERAAGTYSLSLVLRDVMADIIAYYDDPTPTSITEPFTCGYELDGTPHPLRSDRHGRVVGQTTAGKSAFLNLDIAHVTRCEDGMQWICGVQKLYDQVAGWVEPYVGTDHKLPIDWIANGQADTLELLAAAMRVARWRQRQPMAHRNWRKIVVTVDEFSFVAQSKMTIPFDGEPRTAAWLISALFRGAASADVFVHLASQRSTLDHFGDHGGDVVANLAFNVAFQTKDFAEVGRLTNDYKLPVPTHPGEFWLLTDGLPVNLKAPYINSVDPTKPRLHNGPTVADVAWARRNHHRPGLAAREGLEAAGAGYAQRWQTASPEFMSYLTETDVAAAAAVGASPEEEAFAMVSAELDRLAAEAGLDMPTASSPTGDTSGGVATLTRHRTRNDRILTVLADAPAEGLSIAEITEGVNGLGDNADVPAVNATLSRLYKAGRIDRPATGRYASTERTNEQTAA